MKLLALDTSSLSCTAALQCGEDIIERHAERPREHTNLIVPMIRELVTEAAVTFRDLDGIVLGVGPGSFIGVRIATSVAQGIAYASGLGIVPVSSLAAVAAAALSEAGIEEVVVAQDAHLGEVYLGHYCKNAENLPSPMHAEQVHVQGRLAFLDAQAAGVRVAAGDGWYRFPDFFEQNHDLFRRLSDHRHPRARHLLALGMRKLASGCVVDPAQASPIYLRHKVADPQVKPS